MTEDDVWHVGQSVFGSHSSHKSQRPIRTSLTHPLQVATITVGDKGGRIGITLCPGKVDSSSVGGPWKRDMIADVEAIRQWDASFVLTLLEPSEFDLLKVRGLPEAVREAEMIWLHAPIPDVSIPGLAFKTVWRTMGPRLVEQLGNGASVVVHCRGGLGRAGMVASMLLVMTGEDPQRAIERVRAIRPGAIETSEQEAYVLRQGSLDV